MKEESNKQATKEFVKDGTDSAELRIEQTRSEVPKAIIRTSII
jgi:hypothetical protein